ncbi:MAG TPA: YebC/PmpR family DNA-binding transcriptional regulator [Anaerolineae bacterium]|nr:YebC/PmpR family DNA-binding transcriptional regulator [Anaerolineae bacterium]
MSGHSKWSTIKHKKAATDKKRAKIFTRLTKEIVIAAREGGGDVETNNRLRLVVDKAKQENMPKDNIERAIKRGTGELAGGDVEEIMYEGYGPHGVGLLIETVTDNRNRAVADLRHTLGKYGGSMAEAGSVAWQFTRKGYVAINQPVDEDEVFMAVADAGAEDIQFGEEMVEVYVDDLSLFQPVQRELEGLGLKLEEASLIYDPNNPLALDVEQAMQVLTLIEKLEELDDVQNIYNALDITDEVMAAMAESDD